MYPAQTTSSTPSLREPVGHRGVALSRSRDPRARRRAVRHAGLRRRARARGAAATLRGDRDDRQPRVEQRLEVRPRAGDEDADHSAKTTPSTPASTRPIDRERRPSAAVARPARPRNADPEVEDAALLLLGRRLGRRARRRRPDAPTPPGRSRAPRPVGQHPRRGCRRSRRRSRARAHGRRSCSRSRGRPRGRAASARAGGRRRTAPSPISAPHEREAVRVQARRRQAEHDVARPRRASRRSAVRAATSPTHVPAKSSSPSR